MERKAPAALLALDYEAHRIHFPAFISRKMDGLRCLAEVTEEGVILWSRGGKVFTSMTHIAQEIEALHLPVGIVLDGELFTPDLPFQVQNGIIRRKKASEDSTKIQYHIYDIARHPLWADASAAFNYRMRVLQEAFDWVNTVYLKPVEQITVTSAADVLPLERQFRDEGYEGAMLRTEITDHKGQFVRHAGYETPDSGHAERSLSLQKVKIFEDAEFEIIGVFEEKDLKGVLKGTAGGFILRDKTPDKEGQPITFQASGLTKQFKEEVWANPEQFIGQRATVKFFGRSTEGVPRHPTFKALRPQGELDSPKEAA